MDRTAPDDLHDPVAGLLEVQHLGHQLRVLAGDRDPRVDAEEVGRVEERHVQDVALDPLAAVEQASQVADRSVDGDAGEAFDRVGGAHLVGDGADPADPRGDVDGFVVRPATQERLEHARRLVDLEPDVLDHAVANDDVHRAFALDAGERRHVQVERLVGHGRAPSRGDASEGLDVERAHQAVDRVGLDAELAELGVQGRDVGLFHRAEAAVAAAMERRAQRAAPGLGDRAEAGRAVGDHHAARRRGLALGAHAGGRQPLHVPVEQGGDRGDELSAVDRAAAQFEVDVDVVGDGGGGRERGDVLGVGVDDRGELGDVGAVAQRLDAAGGGARTDRHQQSRLAPDLDDALGVVRRW